jgi:hypothetical protein
MRYSIFGSALVVATTAPPSYVQGSPKKHIAAREVQILNRQATGGPYAYPILPTSCRHPPRETEVEQGVQSPDDPDAQMNDPQDPHTSRLEYESLLETEERPGPENSRKTAYQ